MLKEVGRVPRVSIDIPTTGPRQEELESSYKKEVRAAGLSIHRESGALKLFEDLADTIKPNFPDVKIVERLTDSGTVSLEAVWDYSNSAGTGFTFAFSSVKITAFPLTGKLVIMGQNEGGILDKSQWSSDPTLLKDAVSRAYQKPIRRQIAFF